jgi:hypothetical protein
MECWLPVIYPNIAAISAKFGGTCGGFAGTLFCLARGIGRTRFNLIFASSVMFLFTFSHENFLSVFLPNLSRGA